MAWYVFYSLGQYDPQSLEVFTTEAAVLKFLNSYVGNSEFEFTVVQGEERKYKPARVVLQYEREE